ncbi:kelch domain-containing protein 2-like [Uloborus diversus]|uniref:kelch domain-containing protein 2-like n=1 Tax=Uloborus diversus TaxID=327109 RepID=UPI00240903D5|nr:kelch domain-containing protein 2-like [Uloborus diversus]
MAGDMLSKIAPPGRTGHVSVAYEKCMFVWGGFRENPGAAANTYFCGSELWIYSFITERWYLKDISTAYPPGMSGSTAVIIKDHLYVFGGYGYSGQGCVNSLHRLNLENFSWESLKPTGNPPSPVDKMVGWAYKNQFYIFGGFGNPDSVTAYDFQFVFYHLLWRGWTNQFFQYDPEKNVWKIPKSTGPLPSARAAHAAAVLKSKVYIFGGRHDRFRLNDLHCLDMEEMSWSGEFDIKGPIPEGRSWHSFTGLNEKCLILYGGFSQTNVPLSDCWMFDTVAVLWQQVELPYEKPRLWHSACLNTFGEVVIYGGCTSNILDLERTPQQTSDIFAIRLTPKTLYRLCVDKALSLPELKPLLSSLPQNIQNIIQVLSTDPRSNLEGS